MEMYIVLAITLFMMVMFIWNKVPFGVTTMTCCLLLAMFGIVDIPKAFGGFGNKIVVLIAPMLVLSAALGKTSLVMKISSVLNAAKGKRGTVLILVFYAVGMVMAQFIPTTAAISILVIFLLTLDNAGDITPKRLLLPLLGVMVGCKFRFPVGLGATTFATLNGMYEGVIGDHPEYMLSMLDPFKVAIIPMVVLTIYCLFAWKLMPKEEGINQDALKKTSTEKQLTDAQEMIVYGVFVVVMLLMLLNKYTGNMLYLAPAAGVLVLIYTKVVSVPEAVKGLTADMTWMLAGVLKRDLIHSGGESKLCNRYVCILLCNRYHDYFPVQHGNPVRADPDRGICSTGSRMGSERPGSDHRYLQLLCSGLPVRFR